MKDTAPTCADQVEHPSEAAILDAVTEYVDACEGSAEDPGPVTDAVAESAWSKLTALVRDAVTTPPVAPVQADQFVLCALDRAVTLLRSVGDRNSSKDDPYGGLFWYDDADLIETFVTRTRAAP